MFPQVNCLDALRRLGKLQNPKPFIESTCYFQKNSLCHCPSKGSGPNKHGWILLFFWGVGGVRSNIVLGCTLSPPSAPNTLLEGV